MTSRFNTNILVLAAYGWAFVKPIRKLYYNMTITFVSVLVALLVVGIEVLGLVGNHFKISGTVLQGGQGIWQFSLK
jgi:high-affinity nickel-transport protein